MLKTRLITAAILVCIIVYLLSFTPFFLFYPLFVCATCVSLFLVGTEFAALRWGRPDSLPAKEQAYPVLKLKHYLVGASYSIFIALYYITIRVFKLDTETATVFAVAWIFFTLIISSMFIYRADADMNSAANKLMTIIAGFIYVGFPGICAIKLTTMLIDGVMRAGTTYFCLATIFLGDTAAYFIGTRFGKHKLIPHVSPKKSVEGAIGGLLFSAITAVVLSKFLNFPCSLWFSIVLGLCIGMAGQIGDLLESALKRASGYKDSGNLLPGHGGFFDRLDSVILGIPVAYILFRLYFF